MGDSANVRATVKKQLQINIINSMDVFLGDFALFLIFLLGWSGI